MSIEWDGKAGKGKMVVQPAPQAGGAKADPVTLALDKESRGQVLRVWPALLAYDPDIQKHFEAITSPDGWGAIADVPRYIWQQDQIVK